MYEIVMHQFLELARVAEVKEKRRLELQQILTKLHSNIQRLLNTSDPDLTLTTNDYIRSYPKCIEVSEFVDSLIERYHRITEDRETIHGGIVDLFMRFFGRSYWREIRKMLKEDTSNG